MNCTDYSICHDNVNAEKREKRTVEKLYVLKLLILLLDNLGYNCQI